MADDNKNFRISLKTNSNNQNSARSFRGEEDIKSTDRRLQELQIQKQKQDEKLEKLRVENELASHSYGQSQKLQFEFNDKNCYEVESTKSEYPMNITLKTRKVFDMRKPSFQNQPYRGQRNNEAETLSDASDLQSGYKFSPATGFNKNLPNLNQTGTTNCHQLPPPSYDHAQKLEQQKLKLINLNAEEFSRQPQASKSKYFVDNGVQLRDHYKIIGLKNKVENGTRSEKKRPTSMYNVTTSTSQAINQALRGHICPNDATFAQVALRNPNVSNFMPNLDVKEMEVAKNRHDAIVKKLDYSDNICKFNKLKLETDKRQDRKPTSSRRPSSCYVDVNRALNGQLGCYEMNYCDNIRGSEQMYQDKHVYTEPRIASINFQENTFNNNNNNKRDSRGYLYTDKQHMTNMNVDTVPDNSRYMYTDSKMIADGNIDGDNLQQLKRQYDAMKLAPTQFASNYLQDQEDQHLAVNDRYSQHHLPDPASSKHKPKLKAPSNHQKRVTFRREDPPSNPPKRRDPPPYPSYLSEATTADELRREVFTENQELSHYVAAAIDHIQRFKEEEDAVRLHNQILLQKQIQQQKEEQQRNFQSDLDDCKDQKMNQKQDQNKRKPPPPAYPSNTPPEAAFALAGLGGGNSGQPGRVLTNQQAAVVMNDYEKAVALIDGGKGYMMKKHSRKDVMEAFERANIRVGGTYNPGHKRHSGSYSAAPSSKQMNFDASITQNNVINAPKKLCKPLVMPLDGANSTNQQSKKIVTSPKFLRRVLSPKKSDESQRSSHHQMKNEEFIYPYPMMQDLNWETIPTEKEPKPLRPRRRRESRCNAVTFKHYVELRVENQERDLKGRSRRLALFEEKLENIAGIGDASKQGMMKIYFAGETANLRLKRAKIGIKHFKLKKIIGVGAFGKVVMAKMKTNGMLYAIKSLKKSEVLNRNQAGHIIAERDILAECESPWVVKLYHSFQDDGHLYFVMEYVPGGDLMNLLCREGIFNESMARFYTAELILALEYVHQRGFIHRDIKPDNIMLTNNGHIKLTDFGLCTGFRWTHDSKYYRPANIPVTVFPHTDGYHYHDDFQFGTQSRVLNYKERKRIEHCNRHVAQSLVGTPNYISPEVLNMDGHTKACDFWSVGVILFEMVCGYPPFYEKSAYDTQVKIVNFRKTFKFPVDLRLQNETMSLIYGFICEQDRRLGANGIDEIKSHPFFRGVFWNNIQKCNAPFKPKFKSVDDTSNFDLPDVAVDQLTLGKEVNTLQRHMPGDHAFLEFTFRRAYDGDDRSMAPYRMRYDPKTEQMLYDEPPLDDDDLIDDIQLDQDDDLCQQQFQDQSFTTTSTSTRLRPRTRQPTTRISQAEDPVTASTEVFF